MSSPRRLWQIWYDMKRRCDDPKRNTADFYHNKGITYQSSWKVFSNFKIDMFGGYAENLTLDRINPTGNYTVENCRWVLLKDQSKNKSLYKSNKLNIHNIFKVYNKGILTLTCKITADGKSYVKQMSLNKYTEEYATTELVKWREIMTYKLGFSEHHGINNANKD